MIATDILLFIFALGFVSGLVFALLLARLLLPKFKHYSMEDISS